MEIPFGEGSGPALAAGGAAVSLTRGSDPVAIDTMAWGQPEKTAAYLLPARHSLLVDAGSARSVPNILRALEELGVDRLDYVALTHSHPDQAGGAGELARRFPEAVFLMHPGAVSELGDPGRPAATTGPVNDAGSDPFGEPGELPGERIRTVVDGDTVDLGDRQVEVIGAPGHSASHLAWLDRRTGALFCGDALGVRVPGGRTVRPATPPTGFSRRLSLETIERLRGSGAESLWRSHFGAGEGTVAAECDLAAEALEKWHESFLEQCGKSDDEEDLNRRFNASLEAKLEPVAPAVRRSLELISPAWLNLAGMRDDRDRESSARENLTDAA